MSLMTPARAHVMRVSAALAAAAARPGQTMAGASAYELMLAKLASDRHTLKSVQSMARRVDIKRTVLPEYDDYISGVLKAGRGAQDDVLVTVMVWRIDIGDIDGALDIASYALTHRLSLPEQFERSVACLVAEEVADAALMAYMGDAPFNPLHLQRAEELTGACDMPDQVRAKLFKALGYAYEHVDTSRALDYFRRAVALNPRVGVKRDIDRLSKAIDASV